VDQYVAAWNFDLAMKFVCVGDTNDSYCFARVPRIRFQAILPICGCCFSNSTISRGTSLPCRDDPQFVKATLVSSGADRQVCLLPFSPDRSAKARRPQKTSSESAAQKFLELKNGPRRTRPPLSVKEQAVFQITEVSLPNSLIFQAMFFI